MARKAKKKEKMKTNRKAQMEIQGILYFFIILVSLMALGLVLGFFSTGITQIWGVTEPVLTGLPATGDYDIGEIAGKVTAPTTTVIGSLHWVLGVMYLLSLVGTFILAYAYRTTGEKYLLVMFFLLSIILIMAGILMSNVYQNFYESSGFVGENLKEMTLLSWLMLNTPVIMTLVAFIGAVIMFSGFEEARIV